MTASATAPTVTPSAYLTLHYRLADAQGTDLVTTFGGTPATLMLGQGQLAPALEECLLGLAEGAHQTFDLAPGAAFGEPVVSPVTKISIVCKLNIAYRSFGKLRLKVDGTVSG